MSQAESIRQHVAQSYGQAVTQATGCCGPALPSSSSCCGGVEPKGETAKLAGYDQNELAALPDDAVINSFGCGNPLAFSEVLAGDVVLDLGSGAGIDLLLASKKVGPTGQVIGIDMTPEMIERARANIREAGAGHVEVRQGLIEAMPVDTSSVDWVISNCVINLSPEKDRVFAEISRVLKPGGQILISDIVAEDLPTWMRDNQILHNECLGGAIAESDYVAGLTQAGLADVAVRARHVYDRHQLRAFVESEQAGLLEALKSDPAWHARLGDLGWDAFLDEILPSLEGKIWSAQVYARKPH